MNFPKASVLILSVAVITSSSLCGASQLSKKTHNLQQESVDLSTLAEQLNNQRIRMYRDDRVFECPFMSVSAHQTFVLKHPEVHDNSVNLTKSNKLYWCGQPLMTPPEDYKKIERLINNGYNVKIIFQYALQIMGQKVKMGCYLNCKTEPGYYLKWQISIPDKAMQPKN